MFNIEKEDINSRYLLVLIAVAYLFSVGIRLIWASQFSSYEPFYWNNEFMINTNDGYIWATSTLNELNSQYQNNPRMVDMFSYGIVFFTFIAAKVLPFSLDTIIFYMPAVVSSLVVIPIILIARIYNLTVFGFFSALIGSIAWSYYNRTMIGYYDTDMFSAMAPMFILYFLIKTIELENLKNALYASLMILIYPFLYDSGLAVVYAMGLIYMVYMVVFHKNDSFTYQSIVLISLALMGFIWYVKLALIVASYFIFLNKEFPLKTLIYASIVAVLMFLISGNVFSLILAKITSYAVRGVDNEGLKFFQVAQTVREAGKIPFEVMANRISGSTIGVIASLIGYILLVIKYRPFILALPLIGIGVFSLWGGLRFTVYAVPVAAIGSVFLFYVIAGYLQNKIAKYALISALSVAMLFPNIDHILNYRVPTVFNKAEVEILDKLKNISSPKDYTLTWWDYGYPIWYYSNTNTLIDGGKHKHDNFIISKILNTHSQQQAANLSRLAVETYVSSGYKVVADEIFKNNTKEQLDPNLFLDELEMDNYQLPAKTRDIYLYMPSRMLNIFPTVGLFSNLDLVSGEKGRNPFFYISKNFKDTGDTIELGNNIRIVKSKGAIEINNQPVMINNFVVTQYDNNKILQTDIQTIERNSPLSVIFMKNYNQFLVVDADMYNSTYIQMFVLENYNKELFEPVIMNPLVKIYKLKI
jgi:dolichyl-diphosphooligosaccharide--protein glycosyltransferase/undecaprenyl-diphosphooligosaccharide--protein glycosyltransferase